MKINKIIYGSLQEGMRPIGGPRAKGGKTNNNKTSSTKKWQLRRKIAKSMKIPKN